MLIPGIFELATVFLIFLILNVAGVWPYVRRWMRAWMGFGAPPAQPAASAPPNEVAYQLLGVSPSATWEEIERAYKKKAKRHHPDHGGDEDAMRALNEAYQQIKRMRGR